MACRPTEECLGLLQTQQEGLPQLPEPAPTPQVEAHIDTGPREAAGAGATRLRVAISVRSARLDERAPGARRNDRQRDGRRLLLRDAYNNRGATLRLRVSRA